MLDAQTLKLDGPNLPDALLHRLFIEANDAVLRRPAQVLDDIIMQSGMATGGLDTGWFRHPSNKRILLFEAALNGQDRRRNGNKWVVAHIAGVANKVANDPELLKDGEDPNFLAFRAAIHDTGEAATALKEKGVRIDVNRTIGYAVGHWQNDDKKLEAIQREEAEKSAKNLMDREQGPSRLAVQAKITRTLGKVDQHIRVYDKIDQAEGDRDFYLGELILFNRQIQKGLQPDPQRISQLSYTCKNDYNSALERTGIVAAAHLVRDELKQRHFQAIEALRLLSQEMSILEERYKPALNTMAAASQITGGGTGNAGSSCARGVIDNNVPASKCEL